VDTKKGTDYLEKKDLQRYSIWIQHHDDDLTYPVSSAQDFPENMVFNDLRIRARFITSTGIELNGYIVGLKNIYCIVLFINNEDVIYLNKNLYQDCLIAIEKINKLTGHNLTVKDFSSLKFETQIDIEGFKNIQSEFDLSKPRTDAERLDF